MQQTQALNIQKDKRVLASVLQGVNKEALDFYS